MAVDVPPVPPHGTDCAKGGLVRERLCNPGCTHPGPPGCPSAISSGIVSTRSSNVPMRSSAQPGVALPNCNCRRNACRQTTILVPCVAMTLSSPAATTPPEDLSRAAAPSHGPKKSWQGLKPCLWMFAKQMLPVKSLSRLRPPTCHAVRSLSRSAPPRQGPATRTSD